MRYFLGFAVALFLLHSGPGYAQESSFGSLLRANSFELTLEAGTVSGEGFDLIMRSVQNAQFFAIAEEHNLAELNVLSEALFIELQKKEGFDYIALEQGSIITSWLGNKKYRGDIDAITKLIGTYPHAPTFATDEELQLISTVGANSGAITNPIWGVDQELGALHILDRLTVLAPNPSASKRVTELAAEARKYEADRSGEILYLAQVLTPEEISDLPMLFNAMPGSETEELIEALQRTNRIYYNHTLSRKGNLTAYENAREREESMKLRFMEQYRKAQATGVLLPRVMAKLGHWHILRGIAKSNAPTFGNFLSEFALSNGMNSFILSTYVVDSPDSWRNTGGALAEAAGSGTFTVIDFRPLRPYAQQNKISDLTDGWRKLLFKADAALIIRGGKTGSYNITKGTQE